MRLSERLLGSWRTRLLCCVVLYKPLPSPLHFHQTTFPERWRLKPIFPVVTGHTWASAFSFWFFKGLPGTTKAWLGEQSGDRRSTKEGTHELITCKSHCRNHIALRFSLNHLNIVNSTGGCLGGLFKIIGMKVSTYTHTSIKLYRGPFDPWQCLRCKFL